MALSESTQRLPLALCSLLLSHVSVSVALYGGLSGSTTATWYGPANGDGTDAGACGYGALGPTPYKALIAAGSAPLFLDGASCGNCYSIRCTSSSLCSSTPVTVAVTDLCPGGDFCGGGKTHFDLSGTAFGALAVAGQAEALRTLGVLTIQYERAACPYSGASLFLRVLPGFNPFYMGLVAGGGAGPGSVAAVAVRAASSASFAPLSKDWGASFVLQSAAPLEGPFTVRVTASATGEVVTCPKTIPSNFVAGTLYDCGAQF